MQTLLPFHPRPVWSIASHEKLAPAPLPRTTHQTRLVTESLTRERAKSGNILGAVRLVMMRSGALRHKSKRPHQSVRALLQSGWTGLAGGAAMVAAGFAHQEIWGAGSVPGAVAAGRFSVRGFAMRVLAPRTLTVPVIALRGNLPICRAAAATIAMARWFSVSRSLPVLAITMVRGMRAMRALLGERKWLAADVSDNGNLLLHQFLDLPDLCAL